MRFEFATATRVLFGPGAIREVPAAVRAWGRRVLLLTGRASERAAALAAALVAEGCEVANFTVPKEPTTDLVRVGAAVARAGGCEAVVAFGGGSALDAGKAVAALATNPGDVMDYLEVVGGARPLQHSPLPFVAIPTTSGTGTEVTRNAVLTSLSHRVKASLRSPLLLARLAVVDPELTFSLPPALTASTGLDALTQLIEPFLCSRANPWVDGLCREGMTVAARSLRVACQRPADAGAREGMALASLLSGAALANAGLGAVHGFAAPIGGMFPAPHGAVCAALLPHALEVNWRALREREPGSPVLARFDEVARLLTGRPAATAADAMAWTREIAVELGIPGLGRYGLKPSDVPGLCASAAQASSMKANPIQLNPPELEEILSRAL